jgi:hypothetical protein
LIGASYRTTSLGQELTLLPGLNKTLGRPLSIVHIFQPWATLTPNSDIQKVRANGAIPIIDWACGVPDASIISGAQDGLITQFAQQLATLKAPVFLRWFWEPNFQVGHTASTCLSPAGVPAGPTSGAAGYVQAFRHIHDLFAAAGATNVAFVWNIGTGGSDNDWINYYPGAPYVDWITADGYERFSTPVPGAVAARFGGWYSTFASFGKPMMVTETAAFSGSQQSLLSEYESDMSNGYPLIKGLIYFDAVGNSGKYPFDAAGLQEFQKLSNNPMFLPFRQSSVSSVSASPTSAMVGQPVQLNANVASSDDGGSLNFFDNGAPVAGCQSVPLGVTSSCSALAVSPGSNHVTVVYSGDALNAGSGAVDDPLNVGRLQFASMPAWLGQPDFGNIGLVGFPLSARGPNPPLTDPLLANSAPRGSQSSLSLLGSARGAPGYGLVALIVGSALLLLFGLYIGVTWVMDQRRSRQQKGLQAT